MPKHEITSNPALKIFFCEWDPKFKDIVPSLIPKDIREATISTLTSLLDNFNSALSDSGWSDSNKTEVLRAIRTEFLVLFTNKTRPPNLVSERKILNSTIRTLIREKLPLPSDPKPNRETRGTRRSKLSTDGSGIRHTHINPDTLIFYYKTAKY